MNNIGTITPGSKSALQLAAMAKGKNGKTLFHVNGETIFIRVDDGGYTKCPLYGVQASVPLPNESTVQEVATTDGKIAFSVLKYGVERVTTEGESLKVVLKNGTTVKTDDLYGVEDIPTHNTASMELVGTILPDADLPGLLLAANFSGVREHLNGVLLEDTGEMVATDWFRMHIQDGACGDTVKVKDTASADAEINGKFPIVSKTALSFITKCALGGKIEVWHEQGTTNNELRAFDTDGNYVFSYVRALIYNNFPDWRRALPKETDKKIRVERRPFDVVAKQGKELEAFGGDIGKAALMTLASDGNTLTISRSGVGVSHDGQEGEALTIIFDQNLLSNAVQFVHGKKWEAFTVQGTAPNEQGMVKHAGKVAIVMPVRPE